jgi:LEA14-like dessication related protein
MINLQVIPLLFRISTLNSNELVTKCVITNPTAISIGYNVMTVSMYLDDLAVSEKMTIVN